MAYGAAFLLVTVGLLMRVLAHKAIEERSLLKKQSVFGPPLPLPLGRDDKCEELPSPDGAVRRVYTRVWLYSMEFLQLIHVISVKRKISS
jgi:hypothetical protein